MIGRRVHYIGNVQGVGFRFTARNVARRFDVSGYVRNLSDGRVELVVEGPAQQVHAYLDELATEMGHYIHDVAEETIHPTGQYDGFEIRY